MLRPIRRTMLRASVAALALVLSACATMDRDECLAVDWRTVGYEDGVAGYSGDRIGEHRRACAKHGVRPGLGAYQAGRAEGLREYCRPANGFRLGAAGDGYAGLCPADLEPGFAEAYQSGRQLYILESRVSDTVHRLNAKRRQLQKTETDIVTQSALAISGDATTEARAQAVLDVKHSGERVGRLKAEIRQLEADRVIYERELSDYRASLEGL